MAAVEQELIQRIQQLDDDKQQRVLAFVRSLETEPTPPAYSARELMALPPEQRQQLIQVAFALSANEDFEIL